MIVQRCYVNREDLANSAKKMFSTMFNIVSKYEGEQRDTN